MNYEYSTYGIYLVIRNVINFIKIDKKVFEDNWDRIFSKKKPKKDPKKGKKEKELS